MDLMLGADDLYANLRGLNNFRNYLIAIQLDISKREVVGQAISDTG